MSDCSLQQLYAEHRGKVSHKWSLYLTEYERLLSERRHLPARILEIGIQNGGSLELWARYFDRATIIVGCDIDPRCGSLTFDDQRVIVEAADANEDSTVERILGHSPFYDLIIDDGSHHSSDIVKSFGVYFPHLAEGGLYIIEDLHTSYWREYEGGLHDPYSSMSFLKRLVDVVNHEHWGLSMKPGALLDDFGRRYGITFPDGVLETIHSVEFMNSMCVIGKMRAEDNSLGHHVVSGEQELAAEGHLALDGRPVSVPDQSSNPLSDTAAFSEAGCATILEECDLSRIKCAQARAELQSVRQSLSWRITRPLRKIQDFVRMFRGRRCQETSSKSS